MNGQVRQRAVASSPYVGDSRVEYFEPPSRLQLLDKLHHLIRFSDFLLLIQGKAGSGKTSLLRQLSPQTSGGRLCHLRLQQETGTGDFLHQLSAGFALDADGCTTEAQLLELVHAEARHAQDSGLQWLLLVDDADLLDDDTLELLVNLQRAGISSIRAVLAGRRIEQRLASTGLFQELDGRLHLETLQPFEVDEAEEFVRLRYPALEVLDSRKLQQLVTDSDRMPGSLATRASRALRLKSPAPVARPGMSGRIWGGASLMLVVIVAMAGWIYWQPKASSVASERVSVPLTVPVIAASVDQPAEQIDVVEIETQAPGSVDAGLKSPSIAPASVAVVDAALAEPSALRAQDLLPDAFDLQSAPQEPESVNDVAGLVEVVVAAEQPKLPQPEPGMVEVPIKPVVKAATEAQSAPERAVAFKKAAATPAASSEEELLGWPDRGYTLQLLGARQLDTAKAFIADQQDPSAFHAFSTLYKGKPWHVVVIGRYGSRKEASAAVLELPASLQKLKPWARSIQSVKADIRKATR
ncbi:SPOR domain-containing protein [Marinobacterium rhizophilum]|uniref:AAA family ATPase n=1 Tax=Marinobacterium rhizophilum TaxID=420402 RepID=A0ABY5HFA0_9GAMM|nr:AAA family ATPase [Marinobacterium rhizophilum]UTW10477.1 AAA family ATPase [Marinobacterium rhizophilum]